MLKELEKTNNEKILLNFAKELKFNILFKVLLEKLFIITLEQGKLINSWFAIKSISRNIHQRIYPDFLQQTILTDEETQEEIFNGIVLFKGTLIKILEAMNLNKTKNAYIKQLVIEDMEIDESKYYSRKEIEKYNSVEFEHVLKEELKKKHKNKPLIISK
jgi:hypothetical protein